MPAAHEQFCSVLMQAHIQRKSASELLTITVFKRSCYSWFISTQLKARIGIKQGQKRYEELYVTSLFQPKQLYDCMILSIGKSKKTTTIGKYQLRAAINIDIETDSLP